MGHAVQNLLELRDVSLSFAGVSALSNIGFDVARGEICALIGPNGAGKSSLLNVITGVYRPDSGTIRLDGELLARVTPNLIAKRGVARASQNIALFKGMTVIENLLTGRALRFQTGFLQHALRTKAARREEAEQGAAAHEVLELLEIRHLSHATVGALPYGLQKRVELGRALAAEPALLLLDEPMAGMTFEEKQDMCRFIVDVNEKLGTTIVLIEHDMGVVMDLSDHVVVLDYGRKVGDGAPAEVRKNPDVISAYLGVTHGVAA